MTTYQENYDALKNFFGDKNVLNYKDVIDYTGIVDRRRLRKYFTFKNGIISIPTLAKELSNE